MWNRAELLQLPTELLQQIFEDLDPEDHSALRQTCRTTREFVLPYVFGTFKIDFNREDMVQRMFQCLEVKSGITHTAVKAHTRELHVISAELEDRLSVPGPLNAEDSCYTQVERDEKLLAEETLFEHRTALSAFRRIQSVKIENCDVRSRTWQAIAPILEYLTSLPSLHSAYIDLHNGYTGTALLLPHLRRLVMTSLWKLEGPIQGVLAAAPGITDLELMSGSHRPAGRCPKLGRLFRNLSPLKLHSLRLRGWKLDAADVEDLLPHLTHLRKLRIHANVKNAKILWPALQTAQVTLQNLVADRQESPEFFRYLLSFSGLQELTMSPLHKTSAPSTPRHIAAVIEKHAATLRSLSILDDNNKQWTYRGVMSGALRKCTALRHLIISVPTMEGALHLSDLASSLPSIKSVDLGVSGERWVRASGLLKTLQNLVLNNLELLSNKDARLHLAKLIETEILGRTSVSEPDDDVDDVDDVDDDSDYGFTWE